MRQITAIVAARLEQAMHLHEKSLSPISFNNRSPDCSTDACHRLSHVKGLWASGANHTFDTHFEGRLTETKG
jgi:hypothetical protein